MARGPFQNVRMPRLRAITTVLGLHSSNDIRRSIPDRVFAPNTRSQPVIMSSEPKDGDFMLYLRVHSARDLHAVAQSSYCKVYLGDTSIVGGFGQWKPLVGFDTTSGGSHRAYHTKVQMSVSKDCPKWNEKFQLSVKNPNVEILTIRVKNHVVMYSPAIGACVVQMRHLRLGQTSDAWYPLYRGNKRTGEIRLQLCLEKRKRSNGREGRSSQVGEATVQRLLREHRELVEMQRQEVVLHQDTSWKKMEANSIDQVDLEPQTKCEAKRSNRFESRTQQKQQSQSRKEEKQDSVSDLLMEGKYRGGEKKVDLLPSFKYRGVSNEEHVATQKLEKMSLQTSGEENSERLESADMPRRYTVLCPDSRRSLGSDSSRQISCFGTVRLSTEELDQVVQNALPTSESSEVSSSEDERHQRLYRRKEREDKRRKRQDKERTFSDKKSDDIIYRNHLRKGVKGRPMSPRKDLSTQHQGHDDSIMYGGPPCPLDAFSKSSSQEKPHHRRRRQAEKAKRREKEKKSKFKRKHGKSRHSYECSDSSWSSASSSSMSSSDEERLQRKLEKRKMRKAQALAERFSCA